MKKRARLWTFLLAAVLLILSAVWIRRDELLERALGGRLGRAAGFAWELGSARLRFPVLTFDRLRPRRSAAEGIRGEILLRAFPPGIREMQADIRGLELAELAPLSPEHLAGASGMLRGRFIFREAREGTQDFRLDLASPDPGGRLQARFFDLLKPYLPAARYREALGRLRGAETVAYQKARLRAEPAGPGRIKVLLKILVPDYNLDLNLNAEIRVEEQNSFFELAKLLGLVRDA